MIHDEKLSTHTVKRKRMSVKRVVEYLRKLEIKEDVIKLFEDASVDEKMMMELTAIDLERLGVTNFLTRRKILTRRDADFRKTRRVRTDTWRYTIARCLIFIVIFFALHTAMNKYVLEPYFQRPRRTPSRPAQVHYGL